MYVGFRLSAYKNRSAWAGAAVTFLFNTCLAVFAFSLAKNCHVGPAAGLETELRWTRADIPVFAFLLVKIVARDQQLPVVLIQLNNVYRFLLFRS